MGQGLAGALVAVCVLLVAGRGAAAAGLPGLPSVSAPSEAPAAAAVAPAEPAPPPPATVPVSDIAGASEEVTTRLRKLEVSLDRAADVEAIRAELDLAETRIGEEEAAIGILLAEGPRLSVIDDHESGWREARSALAKRSDALRERSREAETALRELEAARETWARTLEAARADDAPVAVLDRVADTQAKIEASRARVIALREQILALQDQAARQLALADEALAKIQRHKQDVVDRLWTADGRPLWAIQLDDAARARIGERVGADTSTRLDRAVEFVSWRKEVFFLQLLLFVALAVVFRRARGRAAQWSAGDPALQDSLRILEQPYSAALVLALLSSLWIHPELPRLLIHLTGVIVLFPIVRILRVIVPEGFRWRLYGLAGFFLMDRVREALSAAPVVEQLLLVGEMALGVIFLIAMLRPAASSPGDSAPGLRASVPRVRAAEWLLLVAFTVALALAASGFMQLARFISGATLASLYTAMAFYAGVRALRALVSVALRMRPLSELRMVRHHRPLLEARAGTILGWTGALAWVYVTAENLAFLSAASDYGEQILSAGVSFGSVTVTVGGVLAVVLTLWASILVSRLVRFVLEEDVYPRIEFARGVPYALSNLVHYSIVLAGFLLALATMGLDPTRFTVLAGALGVGIGFGLQNIVNNFVSGLILLFERPVQVGDAIQIGDVMGEVRRIGIRSSTVRTFSGAEVIVPNADLIAERVTNWTLSDSTRRVEIPVGVAYGTEPERVLALLEDVARKHGQVLEFPAPLAVFLRFGDSTMDYELRAWVSDGTRWSQTRTEIAIAVYKGLQEAGIEIPFPQREVRTHVVD